MARGKIDPEPRKRDRLSAKSELPPLAGPEREIVAELPNTSGSVSGCQPRRADVEGAQTIVLLLLKHSKAAWRAGVRRYVCGASPPPVRVAVGVFALASDNASFQF